MWSASGISAVSNIVTSNEITSNRYLLSNCNDNWLLFEQKRNGNALLY